jgi:K+-transporting ATPase KdpF subunit
MSALEAITLAVSAATAAYLLYALLRGERL